MEKAIEIKKRAMARWGGEGQRVTLLDDRGDLEPGARSRQGGKRVGAGVSDGKLRDNVKKV